MSLSGRGFLPFPISTVNPGFANFSINQSLNPPPMANPFGADSVYPLKAAICWPMVLDISGVFLPYSQ